MEKQEITKSNDESNLDLDVFASLSDIINRPWDYSKRIGEVEKFENHPDSDYEEETDSSRESSEGEDEEKKLLDEQSEKKEVVSDEEEPPAKRKKISALKEFFYLAVELKRKSEKVCFGEAYLPETFCGTVKINNGQNELTIDPIKGVDEAQLMSLSRITKRSSFGDLKTMTTKIDESVRLASEIDIQGVDFSGIMPANILTKISQTLFAGNSIALKAYKLNIYRPGGFFKSHVDTPRDPSRSVGTLVVTLANGFTGGQLVVNANDVVIDGKCQYAAFYNNLLHHVKEVKSGIRATLTFDILSCDQNLERGSDTTHLRQEMVQVIERALKEEEEGRGIGVILTQRYTQRGCTISNLKGSDALLARMLEDHYEISVIPVIWTYNRSYYRGDASVKKDDMQSQVYDFSRTEMLSMYKQERTRATFDGDYRYSFISLAKNDEKTILKKQKAKGGFTGNETSPRVLDIIYYQTALLINEKKK